MFSIYLGWIKCSSYKYNIPGPPYPLPRIFAAVHGLLNCTLVLGSVHMCDGSDDGGFDFNGRVCQG